MIRLQSVHGICWVKPAFIQAIYPLEKAESFSGEGLAEIKCYVALENGDTLELTEPVSAVYTRWLESGKEESEDLAE